MPCRTNERPLSPAICLIFMRPNGGSRGGFDIMQQVERDSSGAVALGAGALCGMTDRMVQAGTVLGACRALPSFRRPPPRTRTSARHAPDVRSRVSLANRPRALRSGVLEAAMLVVHVAAFVALFDASKHASALVGVNPFGNDPYDAVGSFAVLLAVFGVVLAGGRSLVRCFRLRRDDDRCPELWLRLRASVVVAIIFTCAVNGIALARHPDAWLGVPAGNLLAGLWLVLALATIAVGASIVGLAKPYRRRAYNSGRWTRILACGAALATFAVFPESLTQSTTGELVTVIVSAMLLFAAVRWGCAILVPWRASNRTANPGGWAAAAGVGIALGTGLAVIEALGGGSGRGIAPIAAVLFVALACAGTLAAYGMLAKPLGLLLDQPVRTTEDGG